MRSELAGTCTVQLCRSAAAWNTGVPCERSIYNAYIETIQCAEHFIYIENQFFISAATDDASCPVKNQIARALVYRIIEKHKAGEPFRVVVCMPLLPAFPAELSSTSASTIRLIMEWQYRTINKGKASIYQCLRDAGITDPSVYISFYGLRSLDCIADDFSTPRSASESNVNGGRDLDPTPTGPCLDTASQMSRPESLEIGSSKEVMAQQTPSKHDDASVKNESTAPDGDTRPKDIYQNYVTEQVYIHSKVMIIDDRIVVCGSANLNDRSMMGDRDSEIALVIEDQTTVPSIMAGKPYMAAKFALDLRKRLYAEHLGLLSGDEYNKVVLDFDADFAREPLPSKLSALRNTRKRTQSTLLNLDGPRLSHRDAWDRIRAMQQAGHLSTHTKYRQILRLLKTKKPPQKDGPDRWTRAFHRGPMAPVADLTSHREPEGTAPIESGKGSEESATSSNFEPFQDPIDDKKLRELARKNSLAFKSTFACIPDDDIKDWSAYSNNLREARSRPLGHIPEKTNTDIIQKELSLISGHLGKC